jgi:Divergent 4Fe-4S mono-cluster
MRCAAFLLFSMCRRSNGASPAAIIEQVKLCPSGALTYELLKDAP